MSRTGTQDHPKRKAIRQGLCCLLAGFAAVAIVWALFGCSAGRVDAFRAGSGLPPIERTPDPLLGHDDQDVEGTVRTAVEVAEPFVPAEYHWVAELILLGLAVKNKRDGRSVAQAIEHAKANDKLVEFVDFVDPASVNTLNKHMTAGGRRMVDEAQDKKPRLPV